MTSTTPYPAVRSPFLGLRHFTAADADLFFGRDEQVDELLAKLQTSRFVTVTGISGSGKSSLVSAGLIPAVRAGYLESGSAWRIARTTPGNAPIGNLAAALGNALGLPGIEPVLWRGPLGLVSAVQQARLPAGESVLVVADQFEELFRRPPAASAAAQAEAAEGEADQFVKLLLEASAQQILPIYVLISLRSDFLGECCRFRNLPERLNQGLYLVPSMQRDQVRLAIEGPTRVAGAEITARLVERLLNDGGGEQDQLPVLQHALLRTWEQRSEGAALDLEHYEKTGGLRDALGRHADEIYNGFSDPQKQVAESMFRRLTEVVEARELRRPATIEEMAAVAGTPAEEIGRIVDVFSAPDVCFLIQTGQQVDLTHESLIRQWPLLGTWARQEAADRKEYERLSDIAEADMPQKIWLRSRQLDRAVDWRSKRLTANWARRYRGDYARTIEYIERSVQVRRRERVRSWLAVATAVAALFAGWRWWEGQSRTRQQEMLAAQEKYIQDTTRLNQDLQGSVALEKQARETTRIFALWQSAALQASRDLAAHTDDDRSALLARQSLLLHKLTPDQSRYLIEDALQAMGSVDVFSHVLPVEQGYVVSLTFAPDDGLLAAGGSDGSVRLWNLRQPDAPPRILAGGQGRIESVTFARDGLRLASGYADGKVRVWNLAQRSEEPQVFTGHRSVVHSVAFSPDGNRLASASGDATIRLWDLGQPGAAPQILPHDGTVQSVAFAPDGNRLAAGGRNRMVRVWNLRQPEAPPQILSGHEDWVNSVAFSPDGNSVASASNDRTIRVWDLRRPDVPPAVFSGHQAAVNDVKFAANDTLVSASSDNTIRLWSLARPSGALRIYPLIRAYPGAFSRDGRRFATAGFDQPVRVWDVRPPDAAPQILSGHTGFVHSVAFAPGGNQVASASDDRTVRLWDLRRPAAPHQVLPSDQRLDYMYSVAFAPDGYRIAAGGLGPGVHVWDLRRPTASPQLLRDDPAAVFSVAFSNTGDQLASGGVDRNVRIWNLAQPSAPPRVLSGHQGTINSVAFAPAGDRLASGSEDRTIRVWDLRQPEARPRILSGHQNTVYAVAFSPDGNGLASASQDGSIRVWNLNRSDAEPMKLTGHQGSVLSVAFEPGGSRLASSGTDKTVRIWDLRQPNAPPQIFSGHQENVTSVAFSRDGNYLVSGSNDRSVRIWRLWSAAADYVCTRVWRNLSLDEWLLYFGANEPYQRTCPNLPVGRGV